MNNFTINLDNEALRAATEQAIMGTLTPEMRDKILQGAVRSLIDTKQGAWGNRKSKLEEAFEQAVVNIARIEAQRLVGEDTELRARIEALLRAVADKVLSADVEKLADKMADAFAASMRKDY